MSEKKEIYADGIGQIHFAAGMVRFDFMTLQPGENGAAPVRQSTMRVIMPPKGFLTAFTSMQQLIDKLVEAGIMKKNEPAAPAPTPVQAAAPQKKAAPKTSAGKSKNKVKK